MLHIYYSSYYSNPCNNSFNSLSKIITSQKKKKKKYYKKIKKKKKKKKLLYQIKN